MKNQYRIINLTKGFVAIIDAADYRRVNKYSWHVHHSKGRNKVVGQPYARSTIAGKKVYLHRFITGAYAPLHVNHRNHQTLDCRSDNLKVCTYSENMENRRHLKSKKVPKPIDIIVYQDNTQDVNKSEVSESHTEGKNHVVSSNCN